MNNRSLIITACSGYVFFLLLLVPASQIVSLFKPTSSQISLAGISGSVWSGTIQSLQFQNHTLNATSWSLKPLMLMTGNVSLDLQTEFFGQKLNTELDYSLFSQSVALQDLHSVINAPALQKLLNLPFGELLGDIQLNLASVNLRSGQLPAIHGNVLWNKAQVKLYSTITLGNLSLNVSSSDNGDITGQLKNSGGEVSISGDLKITNNKRYTLNIRLKPRSNASKDLINILGMVAPKKVKSEHVIQRSGHLSQLGII